MQTELALVLAGLDQSDAEQVFAAIRLANPGGLGSAPRHDVQEPATVTLLLAMAEAADRDLIAAQYATNFRDVFVTGLPALEQGTCVWPEATMDRCCGLSDVSLGFP